MPALDPARLTSTFAAHRILDIRPESAFADGHFAGAGNIARDEFTARRTELPPRNAPLLVVAGSADEARAAAAELEAMGYAQVAWLDAPLASLPGGLADQGPPTRLWRPATFLEQVLPRIVAAGGGERRALDLAAGAGRESVHLALHGFEVEAVDDDPVILERAEALARRCGVSIHTRVENLEGRSPELAANAYDLITVFRFLHRPLLPAIASALAPGGWLVYETFLREQAQFGRPTHPRFLLDRGELPRAFAILDIKHYEESKADSPPVTARLLARRRGDAGADQKGR